MNTTAFLAVLVVALMTLDVVTGYAHAVVTDTVQSARMRQGFWKKGAELAYITTATFIDFMARWLLAGTTNIPAEIATSIIPLTVTGASTYLVVMEVTSVIENIRAITGYNPEED